MKKKIFIFIILIFLLTQLPNFSRGSVVDANIGIKSFDATTYREDDVLKFLKDNFGYEGTYVPKQLRSRVKVKATPYSNINGNYDITNYEITLLSEQGFVFGNNNKISFNDVKEKYGLPEESIIHFDNGLIEYDQIDLTDNKNVWDGVAIINVQESTTQDGAAYSIGVSSLYTGDDIKKALNMEIDTSRIETKVIDIEHRHQDGEDLYIWGKTGFVECFMHNFIGTIATIFGDLVKDGADLIQKFTNAFQTAFYDNTFFDANLGRYQYNYLKDDGSGVHTDKGAGNRDKYTNVSDSSKGASIIIHNSGNGFAMDTPIPVVAVDLYSIANNKVGLFDANFLVVNSELHTDKDVFWNLITNVIKLIIRIVIYVVSALLIGMLILHGINLVRSTGTNPEERAKAKSGIHDFAVNVALLFGTVMIMAIGIYSSKMFLGQIQKTGSDTASMRVYVEEAGYSFDTTQTGILAYLAGTENIDMYMEKWLYVVIYFGSVIINLAFAIFMLIRWFLMMGLAVIGPIIVLQHAIPAIDIVKLDYRSWVISYMMISLTQLVASIVYMISSHFSVIF